MSTLVQSRLPCPSCSSSDGYHRYSDGHGYCFSCETYFRSNQIETIEDLNQYTYEYLPWRGVSKEAFERYDVKTRIGPDGKPIAIGFKYPNGSVKVRYLDRKEFFWEGKPVPGLFGQDRFVLGASKYVSITEGELDAVSLQEAIGGPVVSVQSASSARTDCAALRSWLDTYERIYLVFDADTHGERAAAAVAGLFDPRKIYVVRLDRSLKDANGFVQAGKSDELKKIWWSSRKYKPETIMSTFDEFKAEFTKPIEPAAPFPFPSWNEHLYGIRKGESYLITALEGVGKTAVMHAIEQHLLKETDANVGAIFLEEPKKRHLETIAGLELQAPVHLPTCNISEEEKVAAYEKAIGRDDRLHVYSVFGSDDPDLLLNTIRYLVVGCDCSYILLDHIGMVVSGLGGDNERQALDYIVTQLEMMCVELNFALIFVSHVNDDGLTRGSRMISKIANNRIDLFRDIKANSLNTQIVVSKNRFGHKTGPIRDLVFSPITFMLKEMEDGGYGNQEVKDTGNSLSTEHVSGRLVER